MSAVIGVAGLMMYVNAKPVTKPNDLGIDFTQPPEHPVTPKMTLDADKMAQKDAPQFARSGVRGENIYLGKPLERPQFVLFILDGCPCSIDAQPLFNAFAKHWKGKVDFVGVIDSEPKKARTWTSDYRAAFPVISDSKKEIIKAYGAKQSVYCTLISTEGKIVKFWPGYSLGLMKEMNSMIAKELAVPTKPFDAQYAPVDATSGCYF